MHVALWAPAPTVFAERLLKGELLQQELEIVHGGRVPHIAMPSAFLEVRVMPEERNTHPLGTVIFQSVNTF